MNKTIILKAHRISKGKAKGEALVTSQPLNLLGGLDPDTGKVVERGHEIEGKSVAGKILVFPHGKGSTVGPWYFYAMCKRGNAPKAIINTKAEGVVAVSAIIADIPMVDELERRVEKLERKE